MSDSIVTLNGAASTVPAVGYKAPTVTQKQIDDAKATLKAVRDAKPKQEKVDYRAALAALPGYKHDVFAEWMFTTTPGQRRKGESFVFVTERLRNNHPVLADVPVLVITSHGDKMVNITELVARAGK